MSVAGSPEPSAAQSGKLTFHWVLMEEEEEEEERRSQEQAAQPHQGPVPVDVWGRSQDSVVRGESQRHRLPGATGVGDLRSMASDMRTAAVPVPVAGNGT